MIPFPRTAPALLFAAAAFAQSPSFGPPASFPAQKGSLAIASADFNADGTADLAVANASADTVSVLLGTGGGNFAPASTLNLPAGCQAAFLTAGHFTAASAPDLMAVCPLGDVLVLPNTGGGTFGAPVSTAIPNGAWAGNLMLGSVHPAIADFDGDGRLDVAIPAFGSDLAHSTAAWYLLRGKGDGTFQTPAALPFSSYLPMSLASGDFNGDGQLDLAALLSDSDGNMFVQFAAGDRGTFQYSKSTAVPADAGSLLLPVDINGDGKLDLVAAGSSLFPNLAVLAGVSTRGASAVTVLLGDGQGGFDTSFDSAEPSYMSGAAVAKVLGTGHLDLVETTILEDVSSSDPPIGAIEVRPGNGDGTFGNPILLALPSTTIPTDLAVADLDSNGTPDIAISALPAQGISGFPITTNLNEILATVVSQLPAGEAEVLLNLSAASQAPALMSGSVANGATYLAGGLVPGSWAQVKGSNLATVSGYVWQAADFAGLGSNLPTSLKGTSVTVNGLPAAIYYVDPAQVNFQVPAGVSGTASVQVTVNGALSNTVTAAASASSPGIFPVRANGVNYAGGVFLDGKYIGDPSVNPAFRNAKPGDVVQLFATGLTVSPAGILVSQSGVSNVTVTIGSVTFPADFAALVAVGEFQINFTVPQQFAGMPAASYPITISVNGVSSPATIDSAPPGPVVIPIQP